jgi:hypothetical protein
MKLNVINSLGLALLILNLILTSNVKKENSEIRKDLSALRGQLSDLDYVLGSFPEPNVFSLPQSLSNEHETVAEFLQKVRKDVGALGTKLNGLDRKIDGIEWEVGRIDCR